MKGSWKSLSIGGALIVLLTVVVYLPALQGGFVWDDHHNITGNQLLRTLGGLEQTWMDPHASIQYYPLTYTGFWVEYQAWGLHSFGYHVVNVLLHALNAFLVWVLLTRLAVPGAWLAAVLFAVHPVHVESVAWITELKNVLSGFFCLSAFLAFLGFRQSAKHRWWFYSLSFLLFLCALLSKTSTVMLPGAILLVMWWKLERIRHRDVLPLIPFFLIGVALGLLTVWVEKHYVGAEGPEWQLSLVERCLVAGRVVWFSAGKLIWPHPLIFVYPRWRIDAAVWWQYLFPLAAIAVLLILWFFRKRVGKGPLAAVLFFVVATAPVPAFIDLYFTRYSYVADHFQYLGSIGLMALVGAATGDALLRRKPLLAAVLPMVAVLSALSWQHCKAFRDDEALWRDTRAKNPDAWLAHYNLGVVLTDQGKFAEAIAEYTAALRVKPDYVEAHNNLGLMLAGLGKTAEAITEYTAALRIDPDNADAHNNLGVALVSQGEVAKAIGQYGQALRIQPDFAEAHNNLGYALLRLGKASEAIGQYEQALRIQPDSAEVHYNLGTALLQLGKVTEAIAQYREALWLRPDWPPALSRLAWILATDRKASLRNGAEAVQSGERLCEITGYRQADALDALAAAYAEVGRFNDAIQVAQKAVELANAAGQRDLVGHIQERLKLYQAGSPYREGSAPVP
ncbi:MAG: tetratricopeptide repeat protein [Verrucomicrobiia bacterium]